jgi:hypothetical protein
MSFKLKGLFPGALLFLSVCTPLSAFASDFWSPRTAALGGAGHAGPLLNDAIYLNPSYTSLLPTYGFSGNYFTYAGTGGDDLPPRGHGLNISIQDGRSELFQAGAGYTSRADGTMLHIGASKSAVQRTGLGLGGKFFFPSDGTRKMIADGSVSFTGLPYDFLQISAIVDNIVQSEDEKAHGFFREYTLGTKANLESILLLYFDPHLTPDDPVNNSFGYEMGVEWPIMQDFFLRIGMFKNANVALANIRGRGYSFGFGWIAPRISLDYGFVRVVDPATFNGHVFGFTVYF